MDVGLIFSLQRHRLQWRELAQRAEDAGFESIFLPEHSHWIAARAPEGREDPAYAAIPDPFTALAAMAAVTSRIKLGTGVCVVPQHDPINLAKTTTTLDIISEGRFLFGVGAGWIPGELADHGAPTRGRFALTWERVALIRALWTGDVIEAHGQFVNLGPIAQPLTPVQRPGPPVLAGMAPGRLAEIAKHADGWLPHASEFGPRHMTELKNLAAEQGTSVLPVSLWNAPPTAEKLDELRRLGVARVLLRLDAEDPEDTRQQISAFSGLLRALN